MAMNNVCDFLGILYMYVVKYVCIFIFIARSDNIFAKLC